MVGDDDPKEVQAIYTLGFVDIEITGSITAGQNVCSPFPISQPGASAQGAGAVPSNPVHYALGPVHGRAAALAAHQAVASAVERRSPSGGFAGFGDLATSSLTGAVGDFSCSGASHTFAGGLSAGMDSFQVGMLTSWRRTDLEYTASGDVLAAQGYKGGDHVTEIGSVHPFVAWHGYEGRRGWLTVGGGAGTLTFCDPDWNVHDARGDEPFDRWRRHDTSVSLVSAGAGGWLPIPSSRLGSFGVRGALDWWRFDIDEREGAIAGKRLEGREAAVDGTWSLALGAWEPRASVGTWYRGGDGESGWGLRAAAGVDGRVGDALRIGGEVHADRAVTGGRAKRYGLTGSLGYRNESDRGPHALLRTTLDGGGGAGATAEAGYGLAGGWRPWMSYAAQGAGPRTGLGLDVWIRPAASFRLEGWREEREERALHGLLGTLRIGAGGVRAPRQPASVTDYCLDGGWGADRPDRVDAGG